MLCSPVQAPIHYWEAFFSTRCDLFFFLCPWLSSVPPLGYMALSALHHNCFWKCFIPVMKFTCPWLGQLKPAIATFIMVSSERLRRGWSPSKCQLCQGEARISKWFSLVLLYLKKKKKSEEVLGILINHKDKNAVLHFEIGKEKLTFSLTLDILLI